MMALWRRPVLVVTCLMLFQAVAFYHLARNETVPNIAPLRQIAEELGDWESVEEGVMEERTMANLQPDDYLIRSYQKPSGGPRAGLMIAYFRRTGTDKAPHSPRNCLPGSGWVPNRAGEISLAIAGQTAIPVNRYLVAKGDDKAVVLYWYQTATRAVANEYIAKIYLVLDAIRFRRSDTALVRVSIPVIDNKEDEAERMASEFSRMVYTALKRHIPPVLMH